MVIGYHVIFGMYGFWLPNDPRGSWSDFVGSWDLFRTGGQATKTDETRSLAKRPHDRELRWETKRKLQREPVRVTGIQARAIGCGFERYATKSGFDVWACAIMPDHVHMVVGTFRYKVELIVNFLKGEAAEKLVEEKIHPFGDIPTDKGVPPKCFAQGQWKVFLDTPDDVTRAIRYVEDNPIKEGLPRQNWSFVKPYNPV